MSEKKKPSEDKKFNRDDFRKFAISIPLPDELNIPIPKIPTLRRMPRGSNYIVDDPWFDAPDEI